jgi:hypothetical protein
MFRMEGIKNAFEVDAGLVADRKVGELVRVTTGGKITDQKGQGDLLYFPLIEDIKKGETQVAGVQVTGVGKVYVEAAAGITAGVELGVGATGKGVAAYTSGHKLGIALATPAGNGDFIPYLMVPSNPDSQY